MLRRLSIAAAALTLFASDAHAQWSTFVDYSNQCLSGGFYTCASVQVYTLRIPTGTYVEIRIRNLMPGNEVLNHWNIYEPVYGQWGGFNPYDNFTIGPHGSVETIGPNPMHNLDMSNGSGQFDDEGRPRYNFFGYFTFNEEPVYPGGVGQNFAGVVGCDNDLPVPNSYDGAPAGYYRTCPSQGYSGWWGLTFTLPTIMTASNFHVTLGTNASYHDYGPPPNVVTPEPVTITLLATGLAGVGGAALRRRKKGNGVVEG